MFNLSLFRSCIAAITLGAASLLVGCGSGGDAAAIGDARKMAADSEVTVEGTIFVPSGLFNSSLGDQGFAIEDETGGIYVSVPMKAPGAVGDKVRVKGKLGLAAKQTVLTADVSAVTLLEGKGTVAAATAKTGDIGDGIEGKLVKVSGAITKPVGDDTPYGYKVYIDDGSGEVQIFVNIVSGSPLVDVASLMVDEKMTATGLAGRYEDTFEVLPRGKDDVSFP